MSDVTSGHDLAAAYFVIPMHRRPRRRVLPVLRRLALMLVNLAAIACSYLSFGLSVALMEGIGQADRTPALSILFLPEFLFCIVSIAVSHYFLDTHRRSQAFAMAAAPLLAFALLVLIVR